MTTMKTAHGRYANVSELLMARRQMPWLARLTPMQRIWIALAILAITGLVALYRSHQEKPPQPEPEPQPKEQPPSEMQPLANRNVRFGMPAKADTVNKDAYLIERAQYVLSYNDSKRTANWVCWNLNRSDIGNTPRTLGFRSDPELPPSFKSVKDSDYTGSGFDRGHVCPSKDRSDSEENNKVTFFTTNIVPQSAECNRGGWERFESHCRDLTHNGSELYIVAGPFGEGGTGLHGKMEAIGKPPITVPSAVWKVVMVLPNKDALPTQTTRTLAVWIPNDKTVPEDWKPYAVSIAEVEKRTGYKFFPVVPDDIANKIKTHVDRGP
jgi:endonuclease G